MLSRRECAEVVRNYLKSLDFQLVEYELKPSEEIPPGFLGALAHLTAKVRLSTGQLQSIRFFTKYVPKENAQQGEAVRQTGVFLKESNIYENIFCKLEPFLVKPVFPKCYFSRPNEVIVLEDLSTGGFKSLPASTMYDRQHCEIVLEALAVFHAASLQFEKEEGNAFDVRHLGESFFSRDENYPIYNHVRLGIKTVGEIMEAYFREIPQSLHKKAIDLLNTKLFEIEPSSEHRNVLTHGDLWSNNIMFSYDRQEHPIDVRLVDFQLARYCPPAFDALSLIYLTTSRELRKAHLHHFLRVYFEKLQQLLKGIQFTPEEIKSSVRREMPKVLCMAPVYLHHILLSQETLQGLAQNPELYKKMMNVDRRDLIFATIENDPQYKKRLFDSIADLIEYVQNH